VKDGREKRRKTECEKERRESEMGKTEMKECERFGGVSIYLPFCINPSKLKAEIYPPTAQNGNFPKNYGI
jgi:hypothetical protein